MNAQEAKEYALAVREEAKKKVEVGKQDFYTAQVELLAGHFRKKIEEAVEKGKLVCDDIVFHADRFSHDVISEVTHDLKSEGFNVSMTLHGAYNNLTFTISWS